MAKKKTDYSKIQSTTLKTSINIPVGSLELFDRVALKMNVSRQTAIIWFATAGALAFEKSVLAGDQSEEQESE